jgi:putative inorganic carbon (HCO3(-)) transporter
MGLGSFREASRRLYPMNVVPTVDIAHAHNVFLQVALDAGIPGMIAYIAILIHVLGMGWAVASRSPGRRAWLIGLLAAIVGLHVYGLGDALAPGAKPGLLYWWVLGAITASYRAAQDQSLL